MEFRLMVDGQGLLKEIPKFFQSFNEAMSEIVQNAYRAGAKTLHIDLDYGKRRVFIKDDGPGADSPEALLTAGRSNWTKNVTDPAGLGLFALIGMSEHIGIESSNRESGKTWRVRIDEKCFQGKPVEYEEEPIADDPGVTIIAFLKPEANLRLSVPRFRHFFPVDVHLTIRDGASVETLHLKPQKLDYLLKTRVGIIAQMPDNAEFSKARTDVNAGMFGAQDWEAFTQNRFVYPIWEYRWMGNNLFGDIEEILRGLPDGDVITEMLAERAYFWIIDEKCQVRPKLPDRRELIVDEHLRRATQVLAQELAHAFTDSGLSEFVQGIDLPDVLSQKSLERAKLVELVKKSGKLHPVFTPKPEALAKLAGYQYQIIGDWNTYHVHERWDGLEWEIPATIRWIRSPWRVLSRQDADMLCQHGIYAMVGEPNCHIRAVNPRIARDHDGLVAIGLCERLELVSESDGSVIKTLPWAATMWGSTGIVNEGGDNIEGSVFLVSGTPEQGLTTLRSVLASIGWFLQISPVPGEFIEEQSDGVRFNKEAWRAHISRIFCRTFLPHLIKHIDRYNHAVNIAKMWEEMQWAARDLRLHFEVIEDQELLDDLANVQKLMEQIISTNIDCRRYQLALPPAED